MTTPLPDFDGRVVTRDHEEYDEHRYQYATSSEGGDGSMSPLAIIYASSEQDVRKAILYAADNGISLAVRTGGHQFSGASSTHGENIQLDLGDAFLEIEFNDEAGLVRTGVSHTLVEFSAALRERGYFVPHGQCGNVHLGGHVHTGGYGSWTRSHGLFADCIVSIEIFGADGMKRTVSRTTTDPEEQELFFAVLGGSPGNYGVVTHFTLKPFRDRDDVRGLKLIELYAPWKLEKVIDVMVDLAADQEHSGDYEFCITMLSSSNLLIPELCPGLDEKMAWKHPEHYGDETALGWPSCIMIFAQWANRHGSAYDPTWFDRIKEAVGHRWLHELLPLDELGFERYDDEEASLCELDEEFTFPIAREFRLPYEKRMYMTTSKTLKEDGFSRWLVDRINVIEGSRTGCKISSQLFFWGGRNSQLARQDDGKTAFSWRKDVDICLALDCFYGEPGPFVVGEPSQTARTWQEINDKEAIGPGGKFSDEDRRLLSGSFGTRELSANWHVYHETQEKYDRLVDIRRRLDPYGVFAPNSFCVGATPGTRTAPLSSLADVGHRTRTTDDGSDTYDEVMSRRLEQRRKYSRSGVDSKSPTSSRFSWFVRALSKLFRG